MNITDKVQEISQEIKTTDDSEICDEFLQAIFDIDEIDSKIVLSYVDGLRDKYFELINFLYQNLVTSGERMSAYLRDGDINGFSTSIHGMTSILATVGAVGLCETALQLETASKNYDAEYCKKHLPAFIKSLLALHNKLSVIFPEIKPTGDKRNAQIYPKNNLKNGG